MSEVQIRYVGENGLEYLHEKDAKKYGGGLLHIIEKTPPKIIEVKAKAVPENRLKTLEESQKKEVVLPSTERLEKSELLDDLTEDPEPHMDGATAEVLRKLEGAPIETLKIAAKNLGLRGFHNCGQEKLFKKIEKALIEQSNPSKE